MKKIGITVLVVSILLLIITYAGFCLFFEDHYYYNTEINGNDYSYKTPVEAEEMIYQLCHRYFLEIEGREGLYDTIMSADIDLKYVFDDSLIKIKREQNPLLWFLGFFKKYSYDIPQLVEYDQDILEEKINNLTFFDPVNIKAPNDAYIAYSGEEMCYVIIESSLGTDVIKAKVKKVIEEAIENLETHINLDENECYRFAAVNAEDEALNKAMEEANKYVSTKIIYNWNESLVTIDAETINEWIVIEKKKVTLDEEKIKEFVAEQSKAHDTYGKNRIFHTTDGRELELRSGAYGWKTDREAESEALINAIKGGQTQKKEPVYNYTAANPGQEDIGSTYVEIDLGKQHLYLYVEGEIVLESDFVSGNAARGWNTPAGVFGLTYKAKNAVLRGEDYETPVNYWMPFNGNIGMHDATWRRTFGGEIYLTSGSHGCINLPLENAKIIYDYIYTGFPVVCYY